MQQYNSNRIKKGRTALVTASATPQEAELLRKAMVTRVRHRICCIMTTKMIGALLCRKGNTQELLPSNKLPSIILDNAKLEKTTKYKEQHFCHNHIKHHKTKTNNERMRILRQHTRKGAVFCYVGEIVVLCNNITAIVLKKDERL